MIGITLVSPVTLYFTLMNVSCILCIVGLYELSRLFSVFNTLSYAYVSVLESFLCYMSSDDFEFLFELTLYLSLGITCTGTLSSVSDVGILSYSIPGTKSS